MKSYNFSANGTDFGNWSAPDKAQAMEQFADDSGYVSWAAMVADRDEFGGDNVEVTEVANLQFILEDALTALTIGDKDTAMCCIDKALEMVKQDE
jgi:hypothetical protein